MTELLTIHKDNPQPRLIECLKQALLAGEVVVIPSEATYLLVAKLGDKRAVERIVRLRQLSDKHHFSLLCQDLSELGTYAKVDNAVFRLLKTLFPGPYTVILPATHDVPRRLQHPAKKTIGLRVSAHLVCQALLSAMGEPLMCSTMQLPGDDLPLTDPVDIYQRLKGQVAYVADVGIGSRISTTVIDALTWPPTVIREGLGPVTF